MQTRTKWPRFWPLFSLWLAGCATIEDAHPARPISPDGRLSKNRATASGLVVSGEELEELSSPYFGVLAFTFENPTSEWVRIENVILDFGSQARNDSIVLPWGEEISSWEQATSQRNAIRHANTTTLLSVLMVGGMAARAGGRSTGAVGGLVSIAAVSGFWAKSLADKTSAVTFPPAHLFATPFSVPPGLFSKKWVLLNGPRSPEVGCIQSVVLEYDTSRGRERVHLQFRPSPPVEDSRASSQVPLPPPPSSSYWQKAACDSG
jgi:hypothetical protein